MKLKHYLKFWGLASLIMPALSLFEIVISSLFNFNGGFGLPMLYLKLIFWPSSIMFIATAGADSQTIIWVFINAVVINGILYCILGTLVWLGIRNR